MSSTQQTPMVRLREETRDEHMRLEEVVDIPKRLSSRTAYQALLSRFYGFYRTFEPKLRAALPADLALDISERTKLPTLERDLEILEVPLSEIAKCDDLPDLSAAGAVGALYVLEGSTLGGQIISRMLDERQSIRPANGGAFFAGYGTENGPMWRAFGTAANEWLTENDGVDGAVAGAQATFNALRRWMVALP